MHNIYKKEIKKLKDNKPTDTYKSIWNDKLEQWEYVPLKDYLNSFSNLIDNNKSIFEKQDEYSTMVSTELSNEITKLQNELNVVDEEDPEKEKIKKYLGYAHEAMENLKAKKQGDNNK